MTYDRPYCEARIWLRGEMRPCGMEFGVLTWSDETDRPHTACRHHLAEVRHRYPARAPAGATA